MCRVATGIHDGTRAARSAVKIAMAGALVKVTLFGVVGDLCSPMEPRLHSRGRLTAGVLKAVRENAGLREILRVLLPVSETRVTRLTPSVSTSNPLPI